MACHNCDAMVRQAPESKDIMTREQIDEFVRESKEANVSWDIIILTGGEPSLHPDIRYIIRKINNAFFGPNNKLQYLPGHDWIKTLANGNDIEMETLPISKGLVILTNGKVQNSYINYLHTTEQVCVVNTNKKTNEQSFYPVNIAPIDNPEFDKSKNKEYARIPKWCQCASPCLTNHGYYPCTTGASIDRVFGMDVGIKELSNVTEQSFTEQFEHMCKNCGYFNEIAPFEVPEEHITETTKTVYSPTWKNILLKYKLNKPVLSKYGQK